MGHLLGNVEPFLLRDTALGERAEISMARGEVRSGTHGEQDDLAEVLMPLRSVEACPGLPEAVSHPTIVTLALVNNAEIVVRQRWQDAIPVGRSEGALAGGSAADETPWAAT